MRTTPPAVLKYFSHKKCSVCKVLQPKVQELLSKEFPKMQMESINIEKDPEKAAHHHVFAAPTILIFFEGKEYHRFSRNLSIGQLRAAIDRPYHLIF